MVADSKLAIKLDVVDEWPPVSVEMLWISRVQSNEDRAIIENSPFFAPGIALGDTVAFDVVAERQWFRRVLQRSGFSCIQGIVGDPKCWSSIQRVAEEYGLVVNKFRIAISVAISPEHDVDAIFEIFRQLGDSFDDTDFEFGYRYSG